MSANWGTTLAGRNTAGVLLVLLKVGIGVSVILLIPIAFFLVGLAGNSSIPNGTSTTESIGMLFYLVLSTTGYIVFLATILTFLIWLYKSCSNLPCLGSLNQTYSPSMSVGLFFIPLAHLVLPVRVLIELWKGSDPRSDPDNPISWRKLPNPRFIYFWWASWLIFITTNHFLMDLMVRQQSTTGIGTATVISAFWVVFSLPIYLFCHHFIATITKWQEGSYGKQLVFCTDNSKPHSHHIEDLVAKAKVLEPHKVTGERSVTFAGSLATEKIALMVSIPVFIIALISHQAANTNTYNMLPQDASDSMVWLGLLGALYLFSTWRALFKGMKSESWGCLGVIGLFIGIAAVIFFSQHLIQNPYVAFWYGLFVALHLWLASIIVRDMRTFE